MTFKVRLDNIDLELPDYMSCLNQEEINAITSQGDVENKIIAAGSHPKDGKVTFILGSCKILIFDGDSYYIPRGRYVPKSDGCKVFLPNDNGRWPDNFKGFTVDSSWLIEKSDALESKAELLVSDKSFGTFEF